MNTPTHLVVNLALLTRLAPPGHGTWIAAGALLPDLPMFGFYAWQRLGRGALEGEIWGVAYFEAGWQQLFDAFNSAPLFAAAGVAALVWRRRGPAWLCASALLHLLGDAILHREDGHRHLWPLADWRFLSPVSYWDPAHHGALASGAEWVLLAGASALLWPRAGPGARAALAAVCALSAALWLAFHG